MSKADPYCYVSKNPPEPVRDVEACLQSLKEEVENLDFAVADLIARLGRITKNSTNSEIVPSYQGETPLGEEISALANRLADIKRIVRSYVNNLGV